MRNAKQFAYAVAGIMTLAIAAASLFIWPNYREARLVRANVADLKRRGDMLSVREKAVDDLEAQVRAAREKVEQGCRTIPETADIAGLIRKLSDPIDGVNVLDQTFTAGTPAEAIIGGDSTAQAMPVAAEMRATFEAVVGLIKRAEAMKRLVRVTSVRLVCKRDEHMPATPLLAASVGVEVIFDTLEKPQERQP